MPGLFKSYYFKILCCFRTLKLFNTSTEDYRMIFTHNTTHSLKLIAESFQYANAQSKPRMCNLEDLASLFAHSVFVLTFSFRWQIHFFDVKRLAYLCSGDARISKL